MTTTSRKELALQSAEKVFAEFGYDGATMRMIADDAGLKLALLTYHFKTKANLYRSVFEKHQHFNELRLSELRKIDLSAPNALEKIVDAFLIIAYTNNDDVRKARYQRIVLREASDPRAYDRDVLGDLFDPMAREFIDALTVVLPNSSEGFARWAYLFSVGAMITSNFDDRAKMLSSGNSGAEQRARYLRDFIVAGLQSNAQNESSNERG